MTFISSQNVLKIAPKEDDSIWNKKTGISAALQIPLNWSDGFEAVFL